MPFNLIKQYPELLELASYSEHDRNICLQKIYDRDIKDYILTFRGKRIYPTKHENDNPTFATHFSHMTTKEFNDTDENGNAIKKRSFDIKRSERLHWVKPHIEETTKDNDIVVFSHDYPKVRTYIWNKKEKYVVILEPQKKSGAYYLLTAYYLDEKRGVKQLENNYKKRMSEVI